VQRLIAAGGVLYCAVGSTRIYAIRPGIRGE
jgi:hypothetical protein